MGEKTFTEYPFKTEPYEHQLRCWRISKDRDVYALFMEMGTGKSKVIIDTAAYLYDNGRINGLVIEAPAGMYMNWIEAEIPAHMPSHVQYVAAPWKSYLRKKDIEQLDKLKVKDHALHILVINVESLATERGAKVLLQFLISHTCMYVVDESTTIKNHRAKRTKVTIKLGRYAKYRRILTGSPIPNGPLDLYSQANFLDPHLLGHASYYSFRNRFAVMVQMKMGGRSFPKVVGYRDTDELQRLMRSFSFIIKKKDCLDLPKKIYANPIRIQMTDEQAKAYAAMKEDAMASFGDGELVTADLVLTQLVRLHQIANGFIVTDSGEERSVCGDKNPKIEALIELLEQASGKTITWVTYRRNIREIREAVAEAFGRDSVATYYGDTTVDMRSTIRREFQDPGSKLQHFIGNPKTGKFGLTLTESHDVFYFSNTYDLEEREQSEDRVHRIGQEFPVVYSDLVSQDTLETRILATLRAKKRLSDSIVCSNWRWLLGLDKST